MAMNRKSAVTALFTGGALALTLAFSMGAPQAIAQRLDPNAAASLNVAPIREGQKVVMATHSFNVFVGPGRAGANGQPDPGPLAKLAAEAGISGHETLAVQMIGNSTPMQHWNQGAGDDTKNIAKVALNKGGVTVFTMSPNATMPEQGIDNFADLVRRTNPNARILVQASWSAWDGNAVAQPGRGGTSPGNFTNADHNKATVEQLRTWRDPFNRYRVAMRTQLEDINKRAGRRMAYVVPSSDAVYTLREHIIRGEVPGIASQEAIFSDAMGHPRTPLSNLVSYVWFATMYRQSPVGMRALVDPNDPTSAARELVLQQIAWNAAIAEPMSGVRGMSVAVGSPATQTAAR